MASIVQSNDLGHPLCSNLREGPWLCEYTVSRLKKYSKWYPAVAKLCEWLEERLKIVIKLPNMIIPKFFAIIIFAVYDAVKYRTLFTLENLNLNEFPREINSFDALRYNCELTAYQLTGVLQNTGLFPIPYPSPLQPILNDVNCQQGELIPTIAAGLPHFSSGFMRCWGRDIFLSIRGLLLLRGHFQTTREHIIAFGSTLRHGLIPNLLDNGRQPRYNARDAVWFWLVSVVDYCEASPEGIDFLSFAVARRFLPPKHFSNSNPSNCNGLDEPEIDSFISADDPRVYLCTSTVAELIYEILASHRQGIHFREFNAGPNLDHAMKSEGFNIDIITDPSTGFIIGGNQFNCGTWMDKMGDSAEAGTKGIPATPRDGTPIEIIGLLKRVLRFINKLIKCGESQWRWKEIILQDGSSVSFAEWESQIQQNFEKYFYIPASNFNVIQMKPI